MGFRMLLPPRAVAGELHGLGQLRGVLGGEVFLPDGRITPGVEGLPVVGVLHVWEIVSRAWVRAGTRRGIITI